MKIYIALLVFEGDNADMGKDIDQKLFKVDALETMLAKLMGFVKVREKVVWKGPTALGGLQDIEIKSDSGFRAALLGLRHEGGSQLSMQVARRG